MAMFCYGSLASRPVLTAIGRIPAVLSSAQYAQATAGVPKVSLKKYEEPKPEHHDIKNERLKRPLSPHLTIYQIQLTTTLSITHRITGMMLTGYATVLGLGALILPYDMTHYINMVEGLHLSPATLLLVKACIAAPFAYHTANGIRHLYWDTARGLSIKEVYKTGYTMLGVATVLTLILAAL